MGDNLPPNVGAEEISEKMKDCCVGLASRPVMACDVQDSERHESVQQFFIKEGNQKGLDRPLFVAGSEFEEQKLVPIKTNVPSDEIAELTEDEQIYDEYSRLFKGVIDLCIGQEFTQKQLQKSHFPSNLNFKQFFTPDRVRGAFVALLEKEDFVNMIWPEIVNEMLRYYE